MHLADAFIQSDLQCIQDILFFISIKINTVQISTEVLKLLKLKLKQYK